MDDPGRPLGDLIYERGVTQLRVREEWALWNGSNSIPACLSSGLVVVTTCYPRLLLAAEAVLYRGGAEGVAPSLRPAKRAAGSWKDIRRAASRVRSPLASQTGDFLTSLGIRRGSD